MKAIFIVIRPNMYFLTKTELANLNLFSMSVKDVISSFCDTADFEVFDGENSSAYVGSNFVAKKMVEIFCRDEDVQSIIDAVLRVNQTNHPDDGMIYVVDLEDSIRIRTGENGVNAIM